MFSLTFLMATMTQTKFRKFYSSQIKKKILIQNFRSLLNRVIAQIMSEPQRIRSIFDISAVVEAAKNASCRGALKAKTKLTNLQCETLIESLSYCDDPFHCAHGRPAIVPLLNIPDDDHISSTF